MCWEPLALYIFIYRIPLYTYMLKDVLGATRISHSPCPNPDPSPDPNPNPESNAKVMSAIKAVKFLTYIYI